MATLTEEQFARLMTQLQPTNGAPQASFAQCTARCAGSRDPPLVEEFINVAFIFIKINDDDILTGLSLLLTGVAVIWWQGVKTKATTCDQAAELMRGAFAWKKPNNQLYQEIFKTAQDKSTLTDLFVCQKRALF
ncbi:activity-regulated cytoskeleton associated protein 2-like, partial [Agrilus planipennis]|uniref:Activity-regulated cytoskeleton associated protein 2-like n=1 Tax=Agrilus planipennis TaxID=224129 RepID=A0A1W4XM83_AGRPL